MTAGDICMRKTVIVSCEETIFRASHLMKHYNVGSLVVVDRATGGNIPVGIVTDRDLMLKMIAEEKWDRTDEVGEILSKDILLVKEEEPLFDILQKMHYKGVRRVPVTDNKGFLTGILSLDDILQFFCKEMGEIIGVLNRAKAIV